MKKIYLYLLLPVMLILFAFNNTYGQSAEEYFNTGHLQEKAKEYNDAIICYTKAIGKKADYDAAYYRRGIVKSKLGDFNEAISDYNMSIELTLIFNNKKNKDEQIEDSTDLTELSLVNDITRMEMLILTYQYYSRGWTKFRLKDYEGAIADYDKAIDATPDYAEAYYERGFAKNHIKDYFGAYNDFDKVIKLDSDDCDAYNGRAFSKIQLFNYEGALLDFNKSIELNPEYDISYYERAAVKINFLDFQGAIDDYSKAIELNPKYGDAYFGRGLVKELLEDLVGACEDYHKAVEIGGEDIEIVQSEIDKYCK